MLIDFNGQPLQTTATTLAGLLVEQGVVGEHVATAVDGEFVPRGRRVACALGEGTRVEVLAPMQGG
jgi:sulfur carrier protein